MRQDILNWQDVSTSFWEKNSKIQMRNLFHLAATKGNDSVTFNADQGLTKQPILFKPDGCPNSFRRKSDLTKGLFRWANFPIVCPDFINNCKLVFAVPDMDEEFVKVSTDEYGTRLRPNAEQLKEIRSSGEFRIPSWAFPGEFHTWKLNGIFQRGSVNALKDLRDGIILAAEILILYGRDRIDGAILQVSRRNCFSLEGFSSLKHSVKSLCRIPGEFLDLLFGLPKHDKFMVYSEERRNEIIEREKASIPYKRFRVCRAGKLG